MATLVIDPGEQYELLHGPTGPVYRVLKLFSDEVVSYVKVNGPLGYDQGGHRTIGLLRADMQIQNVAVGPEGLTFTVGTDPFNPEDGYPYAYVVHEGRAGFRSKKGLMRFTTRDGEYHERRRVGPAEGQPFLYEAVDAVNAAGGLEPVFILVKTPHAGP